MKRFLVTLLLALPILAEAQHRVSRIEVNSRVPAKILLSQSALVEGRSYTDADLEVAVARLRRLPFVYDARYRLDGETLVLDVEAMSRFFGELDASGLGFEGEQTGTAAIAGGGRLFLGTGGVAEVMAREHVVEGSDSQALSAEYSQYGIAGSRFFAIAGLDQAFPDESGVDVDPQLRLTVGYPLTLRSTITSTFRTAGFESRRDLPFAPRPTRNSARQRLIDLRWTYDTSEDPFFARHGLLVSGGPSYASEESVAEFYIFIPGNNQPELFRNVVDGTFTALDAEARKFWPFRTRGTFFGIAEASYGHREFEARTNGSFPLPQEVNTTEISLAVGYGHNLFDWNSALGTTRHRVELTVGAARNSFEQDNDFIDSERSFDSKSVSAAYILRRQFATVRLNLSYAVD